MKRFGRLGRSRPRLGFSAAEVTVAVAILAIALLPVINMTTASNRTARLTEYHVLAQARAKRLLEVFSTFSLEELEDLAGSTQGSLPPPFGEGELEGASFDLPPEYRAKMENFSEEASYERMSPDLGMVLVKITWSVRGSQHDFQLFRLIGSEASSNPPVPRLKAQP